MKSLPDNYGSQEYFYNNFYESSRGLKSRGLISILWRYPHRIMEALHSENKGKVILELGIGFGEHISFVESSWERYIGLDLNPRESQIKSQSSRVEIVKADAHETVLIDNSADRIVATCLIAHLENPEIALKEWNRICKAGGTITIFMPCETSPLLSTFRQLYIKPKSRKMGFDGYDLFIRREHRNSYWLINGLIRQLFDKSQIVEKRRPFPFLSWRWNAFSVYEIEVIK